MIKVNLLPSKIVERRKRRDFIVFVGICAIFSLVICYLFYLSLNQTIYPLKDRLSELEGEITKYQPTLKEIQRIQEENNRLHARFEAFRSVVVRQSFWPKLLYGIYQALPDTIWLDEIKADAGQNFIEIKGRSLNKTVGVAEFIKNMENSEFFSEVRFSKFSRQEVSGKEVMFFELKCFLSQR